MSTSKKVSKLTPITLSQEFKDILDQLEYTRDHYFITGRAGTGKSTLLKLFRNTTKKRMVVLAPTGIAALNVRGQTIHSFFGFPPRMMKKRELTKRPNNWVYRKVETIIIDEISMVRADMLDSIDIFLRRNRDNDSPFGGVQMIFFGDLFQLPPVIASDYERKIFKDHYTSPYFFSSKVLEERTTYPMIELYQVYRQEERRFINLLDAVRLRTMDYDDMMELNERHGIEKDEEDLYITLCSRNATANEINKKELEKLETEIFFYEASIKGAFNPNVYPTESILQLKLGAQVMFVKNDPQKRFVNGTIGRIIYIDRSVIQVSIPDPARDTDKTIELEKLEWEIIKYQRNRDTNKVEANVVGTFSQFPVKLAWAITIHKSQGKTFDRIIIDLGTGAFEYGQTYVALSRCRTLNGIILSQPLRPRDILIDEKVIEYYENKRHHG